jgi:hypothetical protein
MQHCRSGTSHSGLMGLVVASIAFAVSRYADSKLSQIDSSQCNELVLEML